LAEDAVLEAIIRVQTQNLAAFAETRAAAGSLSTGIGGLGIATKGTAAEVKTFENSLKNAVIVSGQAGSITDGLARKMGALANLGFTPASAGILAVVVGLGLAVDLGKKMIVTNDAMDVAQADLNGAIADNGYQTNQANKILTDFLGTNKHYIDDQTTVVEGYAEMLRAGVPVANLQRDLNLALDVSIAKNVPLATTIKAVTDAELGRTIGLAQMGVNVKAINALSTEATKDTTEYNHALLAQTRAHEALTKAQENHRSKQATLNDLTVKAKAADEAVTTSSANLGAQVDRTNAALDAAAAKYNGAHRGATSLKLAQDDLNFTWLQASKTYGPGLESTLAVVLEAVNSEAQSVLALAGVIGGLLSTVGKGIHPGGSGGVGGSGVANNPGGPWGNAGGYHTTINISGGDSNLSLANTVASHLSRVFGSS
jgi:hypothetical protein